MHAFSLSPIYFFKYIQLIIVLFAESVKNPKLSATGEEEAEKCLSEKTQVTLELSQILLKSSRYVWLLVA